MNDPAKITLSDFEMRLLTDKEWILTKNAIVKKAFWLLEDVQQKILTELPNKDFISPEIKRISPKISKGENYLGLPWLMLDYPRFFTKHDVFAIRTFFWWGNFFSSTLHLSGTYKNQFLQNLVQAFADIAKNNFSICIHEEQWHHHLQKNYQPVDQLTHQQFEQLVKQKPFVKLTKTVAFSPWDAAAGLLSENFKLLVSWLG